MGIMPLQWGHRLSAMETCSFVADTYRSLSSFNGATAFQRWKPVGIIGMIGWRGYLQWSHRLSAMETYTAYRLPEYVHILQWGHRLSAMERFGEHSG